MIGCYPNVDDDIDTGVPGAAFDVFIDVPGIGSQAHEVSSVWRHEVSGAACVPATVAGFRRSSETSGFVVFLAVGANGATVLPSPDGDSPPIVRHTEPVYHGLRTGTLEVIESTVARLEVRIVDAEFCDHQGAGDCLRPAEPSMISMEGPVTPYEGGSITQHPRLVDPVSGERLCTPLDFVR